MPISSRLDCKTSASAHGKKISDYVAPDFWSALSEEVHGLRETLESSEDEQEEEIPASDPKVEQASKSYGAGSILFLNAHSSLRRAPPIHSAKVRTQLLGLYQYRVDSVYKILHWPTVLATLQSGTVTEASLPLSVQTLEYSIYFMATCSVNDAEAAKMGLGHRSETLQFYRSSVEEMLARSSLLQTPDTTILQAFVIYLVRYSSIKRPSRFQHANFEQTDRLENMFERRTHLESGSGRCTSCFSFATWGRGP